MINVKPPNPERIYALDALRALMMLLGIILHAGITYGVGDYATFWPIKDKNGSILFDVFVALIHHFRMPVFFVVAGYFGAHMFYKKGAAKMLSNRFRRILLPFLVGVLLVYPLAIFAFEYTGAVFAGDISPLQTSWNQMKSGKFLPLNVLHLWFLYFLFLYSFGGWLIANILKKDNTLNTQARKIFAYVLQNFWLRLVCLTVLFSLCLYWIGAPYLTTNNSWQIDLPIFITYFLFFEVGWIIYKTDSLAKLKDYPITQIVTATLLFFLLIFVPWPDTAAWLFVREFISALLCSLYVFGFIGLFITKFNYYSKQFNYIMNAAYWVYIIHLPVVAFFPGLVFPLEWPVFVKFMVTLLTTTGICFVSYHFFVRNTFIGKFLTGKNIGR
ncbi:acyltransferase family protein [Flavihumibacter fluvii]|uniref:acyltransferase family protein n=1 Tax=Flavihumibacter fluvii TaxID=2838157 RepID=UPI001BDE6B16|nr:acyltransferase family protein [Flavihumibacter fluvii]ULQ52182.1 acyltransferase family protein [Flavihumibacter fluvii]